VIWNDENANQIIDNGETFYNGITIDLLDLSDTIIAGTQTNTDGIFVFLDQSTGQYRLSITDDTGVLTGLNNTTNNNPQQFEILSSPLVNDIFFGYRLDINDLSVPTSNCLTAINNNSPVSLFVEIKNKGNTDINQAVFIDTLPIELTNVTWSCQATGGASCSANVTNNINDTIDMPAGSLISYSITADVNAQLQDTLINSYSITLPNGIDDANPLDNAGQKGYVVLFSANAAKIFNDSFECISPTSTKQFIQQKISRILSTNKNQAMLIKTVKPNPIAYQTSPFWVHDAGVSQ